MSQRADPLRVVVADDQDLVRDGLVAVLDAEPDLEVAGQAADGRAALELVRRLHPDVALLDVRMPVLDGLAAAKEILALPSAPYVVMITTFDDDGVVLASLAAGASGFLLKDAPRDRIVEAVRRVASGEAQLAPAVVARLVHHVVDSVRPGRERPTVPALTPRELDVLRLMAAGLSNAEIAARLVLSETTVKSYVSPLLAKLGCRDRVQATVLAYESGLVRPGQNPAVAPALHDGSRRWPAR